jgi:lipoyl(octanoyl) transferase
VSAEILVYSCGLLPYREGLSLQRRLEAERQKDEIPDSLILLQHPPVYTRGRRSDDAELPMGAQWYEMQGIEVAETDRGGQVTYHGPGQLVVYPIVSLRPYGDDVHEYVRKLERVAIGALADHGVEAGTIDGLTGIWVPTPRRRDDSRPMPSGIGPSAAKIGSIGVHVSRGVTTHGMAINVNNDLQPFDWIVPCGIEGCRTTSLGRELGAEQDLDAFATSVVSRFAEIYERDPREADPATLAVA